MPFPSSHAARIADPSAFDPESFRNKEIAPGIEAIFAKRPKSQTMEIQAYRFDKEAFTPEEAKAWLKDHKIDVIDFAPAKEEPAPVQAAAGDDSDRTLEVAVLAPGKMQAAVGGDVELTRAMLDQCVKDTNDLIAAGHLRPPTKIGHGKDQEKWLSLFPKGGAPATGRIQKLKSVGRNVWFEIKAVSAKFANMLRSGAYGPVSAELVSNWRNPITEKVYPLIVKALAWEGDTTPAVPLHEILGLSLDPQTNSCRIEFTADAGDVSYVIHFAREGEPTPPDAPETPASDGSADNPNSDGGAVAAEIEITCPSCGNVIRCSANGELIVEAEPAEETPEVPPPDGEETMTEAEVKALQAENDALRAKMIDGSLDRLVRDRRISPAQVPGTRETLLALSIDLAEKQIATLAQNPQLPDLTTPLADQKKPDTPVEKHGTEKIMEFAAAFVAGGKGTYAQGLIEASNANPEDAKAMQIQYGLTSASAQ